MKDNGKDRKKNDSWSKKTRFNMWNEDFENQDDAGEISGNENAWRSFDLNGGKSMNDDEK